MHAVDTIFAFLRTLRDVTNILRSHASLTLDDIIALTNARDSLSDLEPSKFDLISLQLKVEGTGEGLYEELAAKVVDESSAFISTYEGNQKAFDEQCSYSNVFQMMSDAAQEQVRFKKEAAVAALKKQHAIFDKYNDITRLYNSRDLRPGQESAEMEIIHGYLEELYDLVDHPVNLDNINAEHDAAYAAIKDFQQKVEEVRQEECGIFCRFQSLVDYDVLQSIREYAYQALEAFSQPKQIEEEPDPEAEATPKKKRGRPLKSEEYQKAGISDFRSAFIDDKYFEIIEKEILSYPRKGIDGKISKVIADTLISSGCLKKEMKSIFDLSNFMIAGYPDKFSIETGGSSYKDMEDTSLRKHIQALLNGWAGQRNKNNSARDFL